MALFELSPLSRNQPKFWAIAQSIIGRLSSLGSGPCMHVNDLDNRTLNDCGLRDRTPIDTSPMRRTDIRLY